LLALSAVYSRSLFLLVIKEFGTHYIHRLVAGGKRTTIVILERSGVTASRDAGTNIKYIF
jgi:hypothetical protein